MISSQFAELGDVIADEAFPEVDLALRRGRHIDREDNAWYTFLIDAQTHLENFYRRFGCELVHRSDGFFYLLPTSDRLGKRHLSLPEMLVGQALTLLYLDTSTVQEGGIATREQLLETLAQVMGTDSLVRTLNPKRKRYDERVAAETVRAKVADAVRRLSQLGFVDILEDDRLRLRSSLMRFAEPVRAGGAPAEALARLVAQGEAVMAEEAIALDALEGDDEDPSRDHDAAVDDSDGEENDSVVQELADELGAGLFEAGSEFGNIEAPELSEPEQNFAPGDALEPPVFEATETPVDEETGLAELEAQHSSDTEETQTEETAGVAPLEDDG